MEEQIQVGAERLSVKELVDKEFEMSVEGKETP